MNNGPSERPTSPDIPTPSLHLGVAIVVSVASIWRKEDQVSSTCTSETDVRVYLVRIGNNEDLKCVYRSTKFETE